MISGEAIAQKSLLAKTFYIGLKTKIPCEYGYHT
jgi:hypothetical protein